MASANKIESRTIPSRQRTSSWLQSVFCPDNCSFSNHLTILNEDRLTLEVSAPDDHGIEPPQILVCQIAPTSREDVMPKPPKHAFALQSKAFEPRRVISDGMAPWALRLFLKGEIRGSPACRRACNFKVRGGGALTNLSVILANGLRVVWREDTPLRLAVVSDTLSAWGFLVIGFWGPLFKAIYSMCRRATLAMSEYCG
jgi:hypothetical protein